ncbi:unnamed protein product [Parajaminaea phylloscopi]
MSHPPPRKTQDDRASSTDLTGEEQGREPASQENLSPVEAVEQERTKSERDQSKDVDGSAGQQPVVGQGQGQDLQPSNINDALDVEELDADLFRSKTLWQPARARGVFGGQVIGMAVACAAKTVRQDMTLHSLHCYFLLAGQRSTPIIYRVNRVRDGGSYATRQVEAQQKGRCIFTMLLSYQVPEPRQPTFTIPLPPPLGATASEGASEPRLFEPNTSFSRSLTPNSIVASLPSPEESPLNEQRYIDVLSRYGADVPRKLRSLLEAWIRDRRRSPVEIRNALPGMYDGNGLPQPGHEQAFWLRAKDAVVGGPEAQKAALAYSSDFQFLSSIPKALGNSPNINMMASLDHTMWFYNDFNVNEWLLFLMQTQAAGHGRGVVLGRIYRRDGTLVAVLAQEGLVRENLDKPRNLGKL